MFEESACQKSDHLLNCIFHNCLTKGEVPLYTQKVTAFPCSKNASTEPFNYPINLAFCVNKNLIYFWHAIFFLDVSHNISQIWHFEKKIKIAKTTSFFEQGHWLSPYLSNWNFDEWFSNYLSKNKFLASCSPSIKQGPYFQKICQILNELGKKNCLYEIQVMNFDVHSLTVS